jgi:hypothetical protein
VRGGLCAGVPCVHAISYIHQSMYVCTYVCMDVSMCSQDLVLLRDEVAGGPESTKTSNPSDGESSETPQEHGM